MVQFISDVRLFVCLFVKIPFEQLTSSQMTLFSSLEPKAHW